MIDKDKVHTEMQRTSIRRRVVLAWDSQQTIERSQGKYVRERSASPYHSRKWTTLARAFLQDHPLCEECKKNGILKAAQCVDHITPYPICKDSFFDRRNLQALCFDCNNIKGQRDKKRIQEWKRTHL